MRRVVPAVLLLGVAAAGCGGTAAVPSPARTATIAVSGETYRVALTTTELVPARRSRTAAS